MDRTSLVYTKNGTVRVISEELLPPVAEAIILLLCFLLGVAYNFIITAAILSSSTLRKSTFRLVLASLTTFCLLDCLTNESIALETLWFARVPPCRLSAFVFHLFLFIHSAAAALLSVTRSQEIRDRPLSKKKCILGIATVFVVSVLLTSPLFGYTEAHFFPYRNACAAAGFSLLFLLCSLLGFSTAWAITIIFNTVHIISTIKKHLNNQNHQTVLSVFSSVLSQQDVGTSANLKYSYKNKIPDTILFLQILLLLPEIITTTVYLFLDPVFETDIWTNPGHYNDGVKTVTANNLEPLFVYSRYMFNAVVPIVILSSDRDVRLRSRLVFCCKWNEISNLDLGIRKHSRNKQITANCVDCKTPVLFATAQGLHLKQPRESPSNRMEAASLSGVEIKFPKIFCDLVVSSDFDRKSTSIVRNEEIRVVKGEKNSEAVENPDFKRNVRFSSKIEAFSLESGVWSGPSEDASSSSPNRVNNVEKTVGSNRLGATYTKP